MTTNKRKRHGRPANSDNKQSQSANQEQESTSVEPPEAQQNATSSTDSANVVQANSDNQPDVAASQSTERNETMVSDSKPNQEPAENKTPEPKKANKTSESYPAVTARPQKAASGFAGTLALFAFLLSVAAGGGIWWNWQQLKAEKQDSAATIAALQKELEKQLMLSQQALKSEISQKSQEIQSLAQQVESKASQKIESATDNLSAAQAELGKANHSILETQKRQKSLEVSIDGLYSRMGNTSRDWVVAEADYLLKVANHRLQLEGDVTTSIQALTLADKRINSLNEPAMNEVRNVIAQELTSLQTLPIPDNAGWAMQLTQLQDQVDQLPLSVSTQPIHANQTEANADDALQVEGWAALPGAIKDVLLSLVSVRYNDKPIEPLLSPEQINNLHENLKLKLEQARLVLLRGDQQAFENNITLATDWINKFFNVEEVSTKKFLDQLSYLKSKQVALQVPDISASLRTLRKVAQRLELNIPNMETDAGSSLTNDSSSVALNE